MLLSVILQFSYFIMLFSYMLSTVVLDIALCTFSYARAISPLHAHSLWSRSDDPGFARPDIGRFVSIVQVFVEIVRFARSWSLSSF